MSDQLDISPTDGEAKKALVGGQVLETWPQDLYIPPDALEIFLETTFQGPLDLLLYLIRKQNLDILDIPVAEITRQYMEYVELMQSLKLDLAAEYLVMAAMLAEIKSRMLLPRPVGEEEDGEDPRAVLVKRLQEYERFREAAIDLDKRPRLERDLFVVAANFEDKSPVVKLPDVGLDDLINAFRNVVELAARRKSLIVGREGLSVRECMTDILDKLKRGKFMRFHQLFSRKQGRMVLVVNFVAILELVKDNMVKISQERPFAPIELQGTMENAAEGAGE